MGSGAAVEIIDALALPVDRRRRLFHHRRHRHPGWPG
jgi:hypothetical protein